MKKRIPRSVARKLATSIKHSMQREKKAAASTRKHSNARELARQAVLAKAMAGAAEVRPTTPSIQPTATLPGPTKPQGSDAIGGVGGYLISGETNHELIGSNLWRTYAEVLGDTMIVAAAVRFALNLIGGVEWEVVPNHRCKDQGLAKKMADLVREGLVEGDMPLPFAMIAKKAALYRWYGFSLHNWIWRRRSDGTLVYADVQHRPQHTIKRWDIRAEGSAWQGVEQETRQGGRYYMKRSRLWYCADLSITDSPQGVGLLRHVVEGARRLQRYEQLEGYGYDANLRGVPIGRAPLEALARSAPVGVDVDAHVDAETYELSQFLAKHIKTADQGFLLDSAVYTGPQSQGGAISGVPKWAIDLLQGDDMGLVEISAVVQRLNREIARVMNAEHLLLGETSVGSNAMHEDKTTQQGAFLNSTTGELAVFARNDLARPLVAANHGDIVAAEATPVIVPSPISTDYIRTATGAVLDMVNAGAYVPPDDEVYAAIRKRGRLPPPRKIPPEIRGALEAVPPDLEDPNNPDNGGDGDPGDGDPNDDDEDPADAPRDAGGDDAGDSDPDQSTDELRPTTRGAPPKKRHDRRGGRGKMAS